jgi:hypothetical protein
MKGDKKMSESFENPAEERLRRERRERGSRVGGSLFFPIILIALGIVFLLRNMGALPGDVWDVILSLWPIILIAMGLDSLITRQGIVAPAFFIAIGTVILLNNLDIVQWNVWEVILNLWPVLIIAIGLDILVARRSAIGAALALLLLAAILAGALWIMGVGAAVGSGMEGQQIVQTLEGAEQAVVVIDPAVGYLNIAAFPPDQEQPGTLMTGTVNLNDSGTLERDYSVVGGTGTLTLSRGSFRATFPSMRGSEWGWDLYLNPQTPLNLNINMGAGSIEMDLSALQVTDLDVDLGVGRTEVTLPDLNEPINASINGAVGEMIVYIPSSLSVRVTSNTGLALIDVPDGYTQDGDVYVYNGDGADPENRLDLHVDQAIGRISIRTR